jgi:hypothetical protein
MMDFSQFFKVDSLEKIDSSESNNSSRILTIVENPEGKLEFKYFPIQQEN